LNTCHCLCIVMFVPPNCTAHGNSSLRVRSIFYLSHFHVMVDDATELFVLHTWLLRRSQLKYGKIIDNHIAGKKTQRTSWICCDLWITKETYQKLLWYTTLFLQMFCKWFLNRFLSKFGFFQIIIVIAHFWFFSIFFLSKLSTHKMTTACILFTYVSKCIYYAFFKTAQYVSSLRTPNTDWK
jgi:hypothetical protein